MKNNHRVPPPPPPWGPEPDLTNQTGENSLWHQRSLSIHDPDIQVYRLFVSESHNFSKPVGIQCCARRFRLLEM